MIISSLGREETNSLYLHIRDFFSFKSPSDGRMGLQKSQRIYLEMLNEGEGKFEINWHVDRA